MKIFSLDEKLKEIREVFRETLPGIIAEINSERTDFQITPIDGKDFYFNMSEAANAKVFALIEGRPKLTKGMGGKYAEELSVNIFIGFETGNVKKEQATFTAYRYQAAILETMRRCSERISYSVTYDGCDTGSLSLGNKVLYGALCSFGMPVIY